jgi:CRP-like cAMP-binding protein
MMEVMNMDLPSVFFKGLGDDQLKRIAAVAEEVSMENGREIVREDAEAKVLYILKTGAVELLTKIENEVELPISMLRNQGEIIGSGALISPH